VRGFAAGSAALLWLASGCYFSPAPLPEDPASERPSLNLNGAVPPPFQVLNVRDMDGPVNFTVPFTSVDAGNRVVWYLWANWNMANQENKPIQDLQTKGSLPARPTSGDVGMGGAGSMEREIQFAWTRDSGVKPGCNQLTLFVTNDDNINIDLDVPTDLSQAAIATYWVNFNAPLDQSQTLVDCPVPLVGGP
jgi:hypothetical protein